MQYISLNFRRNRYVKHQTEKNIYIIQELIKGYLVYLAAQ